MEVSQPSNTQNKPDSELNKDSLVSVPKLKERSIVSFNSSVLQAPPPASTVPHQPWGSIFEFISQEPSPSLLQSMNNSQIIKSGEGTTTSFSAKNNNNKTSSSSGYRTT
jgi:hypothetical protein